MSDPITLYVEYRFVVPVEIGPDVYDLDEWSYEALAEIANDDSDFHELLPDEPVPFVEASIEVLDEVTAKWYAGESADFALSTKRATP